MYLYYYLNKEKETTPQKISHNLLKQALRDYNGKGSVSLTKDGTPLTEDDFQKLKVSKNQYGKPYFDRLPNVHFSITHSGDCWVCAMSDNDVGADIEYLERKRDIKYMSIARRFLTEDEQVYAERFGVRGFFQVWTRKEAYVKYLGRGLSYGLSSFNTVKEGELIDHIGDGFIREKNLCAGYLTSICTSQKNEKISIVELEGYNGQ